jgi:hypothetical protein
MKELSQTTILCFVICATSYCGGQNADFVRGDCNQDGTTDFVVADAVAIVEYLFSASACGITCLDACDVNDDGILDIQDSVAMLNLGLSCSSPVLPQPWPTCGPDPTSDSLGCDSYVCGLPPLPVNPAIEFGVSNASGLPGNTVTVGVWLTIPSGGDQIKCWTYGLCHDPTALQLTAVTSIIPGIWVDLITISNDGFVSEVAMDTTSSLGPGTHVVAEAEYLILSTGTNSTLDFCTTINGCSRPIAVYSPGATSMPCSQEPVTMPGIVTIGDSGPCLEIIEDPTLECNPSGSGHILTIDFINLSGVTVHKAVIPGEVTTSSGTATVLDNVIVFDPEILDGAADTFSVRITQAVAGDSITVPFALMHKNDDGSVVECCSVEIVIEVPPCDQEFIRCDNNRDGGCDIGDAIFLLAFLFSGGDPCSCEDACDCNDDGSINIADAIFKLTYLFSGGSIPPSPYPLCGPDPTPDSLDCQSFPPCP